MKKVYSMQELMAEIGGFTKTVIVCIEVGLYPLTTILFYNNMIQRIYLIDKKDQETGGCHANHHLDKFT